MAEFSPTKPIPTQCIDFDQDNICQSIVLANGTMIDNPNIPTSTPTPTTDNQTQSAIRIII